MPSAYSRSPLVKRGGYVERNLMPSEHVSYTTSMHWCIFLPAIFIFAMALAIAFGGGDLWIFSTLMFFFMVLPLAVNAAVVRMTAEYAVTDRRLIMKQGFISRKTVELLLTKAESLQVDQSILGRMFDYGTITVSGTGGSATQFAFVSAPLQLRKAVHSAIESRSS